MKANEGKYILVVEGAIPTKDDGIYCMIGGKTALQMIEEVAEKAGGDHRHRLVRLLGRDPLRRPQSHRGDRRPDDPQGQDRGHPARVPGQPLHLPGHGAAVRGAGDAPRPGRQGPPAVRLRAHHPRALPAAGALRRRALRAAVRGRGAPSGLVPVQDGLQGTGHPRQLLDAAVRGDGRRLAHRARPPVLRLHGAEAGLPGAAARHRGYRPSDAARHLPAHRGGAGQGRRDRHRRHRPRGRRGPGRGLQVREEARRGG